MKIKKSRLLQIIREEVELHEKNTYELDEETVDLMQQLGQKTDDNQQDPDAVDDGDAFGNEDSDGDGKLDSEEMQKALNKAIKVSVRTNKPVATEDRLFTKQKPHHIIEPNKNDI